MKAFVNTKPFPKIGAKVRHKGSLGTITDVAYEYHALMHGEKTIVRIAWDDYKDPTQHFLEEFDRYGGPLIIQ